MSMERVLKIKDRSKKTGTKLNEQTDSKPLNTRTTIGLRASTKDKLDANRAPGQCYDGFICQLVDLWEKVNGGAKKGYVNAFGAISAGQAMQQAKAGLEAVYLSGWQVAADGNTSETMYPDQSLYAYDSVPTMVRRINNTFKRADEIQWSRGINPTV